MNTETAFLELDTFVLAGTSNINTAKTNFIFRNVNLKSVMGEMWNKYEKFCIRMVSCRYYASVSVTGSTGNIIQNNIKGFDWINCYEEKYGSAQTYLPIGIMAGSNTGRSYIPTNNHYCFNFRKGQQIINIEFLLTNIGSNGGGAASSLITAMPDQSYTFIIQPAENNQNEMAYMGLYTTQTTVGTITTPIQYPGKNISNNCRTYTYNGFDMRNLCREFWDKYEDFEILLAGYQYQGYGGQTAEMQIMPITLNGFNWMNNYTDAGTQTSTSSAVIAITKAPADGSSHQIDINNYYAPVQFKKSGDLVTFTIEFRNFDNSAITQNATLTNRIGYLPFFVRPVKSGLNSQKGTLSVSSAGLTTTPSQIGVTNATFTDITINNVDLRQACESFWHKYNKFNIFFTAMYPNDTVGALEERAVAMYCEGLQLDAQMSDENPQLTTQTWNLGAVYTQTISSGANGAISFGNTKGTTFYKSSDQVNLRFYVKEIGTPSATVSSQILRGTLTFTIVPIEE